MKDSMHIKIVPKSDPNAKGRWITVALRTERYNTFADNVELYASDIPADFFPVSFTRFDDIKERLP